MSITEEHEAAILRLKDRLQKGVPPLMEANARDMPLIFEAAVILYEDNLKLATAGLRLAEEAQERARQDGLSMELGKPRE